MDLGPYAAFIVGAYGVTLLIMSMIITWIWLDQRQQTKTLADLEARGITRRSERPNEEQS